MDWVIRNAVATLLVPPGVLLLLAFFGWRLLRRRPRIGRSLIALALIGLYALSTPYVGDALLKALEAPPVNPLDDRRGEAIVILGGGQYFAAPEYGGDTVHPATLARLRYGARLQRMLDKPILVTGGAPEGGPDSEARAMKAVLTQEFGVPVAWTEERSTTTLENARLAFALLGPQGVRTVYLVTHAWHLPRAKLAFEHAGFTVIPAPTLHVTRFELTALDFLPWADALLDSSRFFREVIGIAWYRLKFLLPQ